jgi:hypothetical protein
MATYSKEFLSGTPATGRVTPVVAVATPGTLIHTSHATAKDEIYIWVSNVTVAAATLTLEWGGTTDPGDHMTKALSIPANSPPIPIVTGVPMNNSLVVRAFSGTASALNISGFVNRIT